MTLIEEMQAHTFTQSTFSLIINEIDAGFLQVMLYFYRKTVLLYLGKSFSKF